MPTGARAGGRDDGATAAGVGAMMTVMAAGVAVAVEEGGEGEQGGGPRRDPLWEEVAARRMAWV